MLKKALFAFAATLITTLAFGQGMGKTDNPIYKPYFDSLMRMEYNYPLPILGKGAYSRGYDIPFPLGISAIYFTQRQEINIDETLIGFNGSELVDVSDFIEFGPTIATTNAYSVRPDIWLLPFLNVYGLLGLGTTETEVTLLEPIGFETDQRFTVNSFGLGVTLAGAVGPIWLAWDNNYNFADVSVIVEPVPAFNSSLRVGHTFLDPDRPDRSFSVWAGFFYQSIQNDTEGSIPLESIFPDFGSGNITGRLEEWAETLPPAQRVIVNQIIGKVEDIVSGIDPGESNIDYKLNKSVAGPINLIFGAQYQLNKNWMLRTEFGAFGKRSQFLLNLNYRFQGFVKR